jgi:hypothetical protein
MLNMRAAGVSADASHVNLRSLETFPDHVLLRGADC